MYPNNHLCINFTIYIYGLIYNTYIINIGNLRVVLIAFCQGHITIFV